MSERFGQSAERAGQPSAAEARQSGPPDQVPQHPFSWAVPPGGPSERAAFPADPAPVDPSAWAGTTAEERPWAPPVTVSGRGGGAGAAPPGPRMVRGRGWLPVAVVAALIGAGVGGGIAAITKGGTTNPGVTTIKEGSSAPGPAIAGGADIPQLVDRVLPAVVSIDVKAAGQEDQGTGMIISPNGMVVTNFHVVALAAEAGATLTVTESGSTNPIRAKLLGADQTDDVALIQIEGAANLKTVTFGDSTKAVVGDAVVAIGNALGLSQGSPTVTSGIVSAIGRTVTVSGSSSGPETLSDLIQTDAAINSGNSGGPLIDSAGQVIGMNTAVAGTTSAGTNAQNIGFAIPSAEIETLLPELESGATQVTTPGYLGVDIATLTPQLRAEYGFTPNQGAIVLDVVPGGPAASAGLAQDDVIVAIDDKPITSYPQLQQVITSHQAGQRVTVTYYRGAAKHTTSVTLISLSALQNLENQAGGLNLP